MKKLLILLLALGVCACLAACGDVIATVNGKPVRVSSCGFQYNSEVAKLVLESLAIQ